MTTRRNNMFHDRGEQFMLNMIIKLADFVESLDDLKSYLYRLKDSKPLYVTDCLPGFTTSTLEGKSLVTNRYFIQYKDHKYTLLSHPAENKVDSFILWSSDTSTQCIIDVFSNEFIDDSNIEANIANLVNIADDWEVIDDPMIIKVTNKYVGSQNDLRK